MSRVFVEQTHTAALAQVLYCFAGHALFPSLYRSLPAKGRQEAWLHVVNYSYGVVLGCSALVAALGYVLFGDAVSDQISVDVATQKTQSTRPSLSRSLKAKLETLPS